MTDLPEGWKQVTLGEILTEDQAEEAFKILKETPKDKCVNALKVYFRTIEKELEGKGMLPDYLAYVLYAKQYNIID